MTITADVQEAMKYLNSNIINLSTVVKSSSRSKMTTLTSILLLQADTSQDLNYFSAGKQKTRNAWTKDLLLYNIWNPIRLGINIARTTKLWKSLINLYDKTSELALLHVKKQPRNLYF